MRAPRLLNMGLLILVNLMWAAQYPAYKVASHQIGPIAISVWAFLLGTAAMLPFLLRERSRTGKAGLGLSRRTLAQFIVFGVLGLIPACACVAWGTDHSTASNAALLYLTIPILTAVLAAMLLPERMTRMRWASLAISLVGVIVISMPDWRQQELGRMHFLAGNVMILLACLSSAYYNVYSKVLLKLYSDLEVLVYGYVVAVVSSIPLLIWAEPFDWRGVAGYSRETWISLVVLSIVSWGLAMVLWMFVLRRIDVTQASISVYLLPFFGVLLSAIVLRETVTGAMIAGGAITLAGTVLATLGENAPPAV
jgi:drug/metabolite transporter (DMT)-like permease